MTSDDRGISFWCSSPIVGNTWKSFCKQIGQGQPFCRISSSGVYLSVVLRHNERLLAKLEQEKESPQYRNRSSRLQKWRELATQAHQDLDLPPSIPERIEQLGLKFGSPTLSHVHPISDIFFIFIHIYPFRSI